MEKSTVTFLQKILLIGGSAGSLEVLVNILPQLKPICNFAIVIILHRKSGEDVLLENLIARKSTIPLAKIEDKVILKPGFVYVAPSDYHLLFEKNGQLSLDVSEKINYSRPSIDVSFETAAAAFEDKCIAVLLSGANSDGAKGLKAIQQSGGTVILQNPKKAIMPFMPQNALAVIKPDYIFEVDELLAYINFLDNAIAMQS